VLQLLEASSIRTTAQTGVTNQIVPTVAVAAAAAAAAVWELFTASSAFKGHFGNVVQRVVAGERPAVPEEAPEEYRLLMTSW
jgi:hypothetical protein